MNRRPVQSDEVPTEIKVGPITLFFEPEPPLPSVKEQAREVGTYMIGLVSRSPHSKDELPRWKRLQAGDVEGTYRQLDEDEAEEFRQRLVSDAILNRALLQPEAQLQQVYENVRAQTWGAKHGLPITWPEWIEQAQLKLDSRKALEEAVAQVTKTRLSTSASDNASLLARAAAEMPGRAHIEVRAAEDALLETLFVEHRIAYPIHEGQPIQLPERIPAWAWYAGLTVIIPGWWKLIPENGSLGETQEPRFDYGLEYRQMLSAPPYAFMDRASRDGRNWEYSSDSPFPTFRDNRTAGMMVSYGESLELTSTDLAAAVQLAIEQVQGIDDRTADVWRAILWKAAENGAVPENTYSKITIDTREMTRILGYKPHHKGGMKPEHLLEVQKALQNLERMTMYISPEAKNTLEWDRGQAKGKRKPQAIQKPRREKVIKVMGVSDDRNLLGQVVPTVWEIALGDWARLYPRSYAPMFKALVELPSKQGVHKWAKRIGTELVIYYRQDAQGPRAKKKIKWSTLLDRAGLMNEVTELRASPNRSRITKYAEGAMDVLLSIGVVKSWEIAAHDLARITDGLGKPGNLDVWLNSVVEVTVPDKVLEILETISPPKKKA